MSDLISRQAAIDAMLKLIEARHGWDSDARGEISGLDAAMCEINNLPSAQDEAKPIEYRDCANAMLRMWMDGAINDGEYNRIIDKLNAYWRDNNVDVR